MIKGVSNYAVSELFDVYYWLIGTKRKLASASRLSQNLFFTSESKGDVKFLETATVIWLTGV